MNQPPANLLPNAEYWIQSGSVKIRATSLMEASRIAMDRCRKKQITVEIYDSQRIMIGQARLDVFGRPIIQWDQPMVDAIITGTAVLATCAGLLAVLIALARL
jgi:hypothetical protein